MRSLRPLAVILVLSLSAALPAQKSKTPQPRPWDQFDGGWTVKTKTQTFHTTLDKKELPNIAARIEELTPAYEQHFGTKLKRGWTFVVLKDHPQYQKYAKEVTKGQTGVQGQCFRDQKIVSLWDHKHYGWLTTLSHEYAHAYYDSTSQIWIREGIASLVEVAEVTGKGKKRKMTIPVNPPRLRGLRLHQRGKHYKSVQHLVQGKKEPDGYGYSYEHGWSLHYFLYKRDENKYRAFLKEVRTRPGDLSAEIQKFFGLDLAKLDEEWLAFTAKLKE